FNDYLNDLFGAWPGFACKMFSENYANKRLRQGEVTFGIYLTRGSRDEAIKLTALTATETADDPKFRL
ncbi:hypothetical protein FOZ63_021794, partial [Perkinsus olseni]